MIFDLQLFTDAYNVSLSSKTILIGGTVGFTADALSAANTSWVGYKANTKNTGGLTFVATGGSGLADGALATDGLFALGGVALSGLSGAANQNATSLAVFSGDYTYRLDDSVLANLSVMSGDGAKFEILDVANGGLSINAFDKMGATFTFKNTTTSEKIYFEGTTNALASAKAVVIGNSDGAFSLTGSNAVMKGGLEVESKSSGAVSLTAAGADETINISGANVAVSLETTGAGLVSKISDTTANVSVLGAVAGTTDLTLESAKKVSFTGNVGGANVKVTKMDDSSALDISAKNGVAITAALYGGGQETITLGSKGTAKGDVTATNFKESAGDTSEGNTVVLGSKVSGVNLDSVNAGVAVITGDSIGTASLTSSKAADSRNSFGVNLKGTDTTVATLFLGTGELNTEDRTDFEEFKYVVGNKTIKLGDSASKDNWFFGRSYIGDTENTFFTDKAYYKDITTITGSNAKAELIVNGSTNSMSIVAAGSGDTIWGGDNGVADTLVSAGSARTEFATGSSDGKDLIKSFAGGSDVSALSSSSDILHVLGNVGVLKAESGAFTIGENTTNNAKIEMTDASGGNDMYLTFGLNGENKIARVDVSSAGQAMTYNKNANYYVGQGSASSLVISADDGAVEFGFDDAPGLISIGALDGSAATKGSVLVGANNRKTDVTASSTGASSIAGGFIVTNGIVNDAYNDNLVGGVDTTFMVGQYMGDDKITGLADGDTIRFLNTKVQDLVDYANPSKNATKFTFATKGGASITASSESKLSTLTNITAEFDDETLKWNGEEWTKA